MRYTVNVELAWEIALAVGWIGLGLVRRAERRKRTLKELELCTACRAAYEEHFKVTKISRGADQKITCAGCNRRRYGARYALEAKDEKK